MTEFVDRKIRKEMEQGNKIESESLSFRWLRVQGKKEKVYYKEVIYLRKIKGTKYVEYITEKGRYRERINLKELRTEIESFGFVLIDRSCMVNTEHISGMGKVSVHLDNGEELIISRDRRTKVKGMICEAGER